MAPRYFAAAFLLANALWSGLLVAAPYLVAPGEARGLDGHANAMDHRDHWSSFPPLAQVAYALGDLQCHQMASRSLIFNGNQAPVDARMWAMFLAGNLGFALAWLLPIRPRARDAILHVFPRRLRDRLRTPRRRLAALVLALGAGLGPTAVDGFLQLLTPYESTNALRLVTGAWMGLVGALWLALVFDGLNQPVLPPATYGARPRDGPQD